VRELRNVIERLVIATDGEVIGTAALPQELADPTPASPAKPTAGADRAGDHAAFQSLKEAKAAAERRIVLTALQRNGWHITRTAAELGLADHSSLLKIMRRHGLRR
jgi:DNA-binding NtrC family response regulator